MRFHAAVIVAVLAVSCAAGLANDDGKGDLGVARQLLRRASDLAAQQDEGQRYWTERCLLQIGRLQIRVGDFTGARRSIRNSGSYYHRNPALVALAEELAGVGERTESLDILHQLGSKHGGRQDHLNDGARLRWIDYLVSHGDLERARVEVDKLESKYHRPAGLRRLALGYANAEDPSKASHFFELALQAGGEVEGYAGAKSLWEIGEVQLSAGAAEAVKATIARLIAAADGADAWTKAASLREAAALSAKLKDRAAADRLFRQAIEARPSLDSINGLAALKLIAMTQARVGYIEDARRTAEMIKHDESRFSRDDYREEALLAVVEAHLRAEDPDGAVRTALSIKYFLQYRDDSLHAVVEYRIKKGEYSQALAAAKQVDNASRRAAAILKTATAYARSGDRKKAVEAASQIKLTSKRAPIFPDSGRGFDYRRPDTWGVNYDLGLATTGLSRLLSVDRTAEVAEHAMIFAQAIGYKPEATYDVLFNDIRCGEAILALARGHASSDAADALRWARRVGSDKKAASKDDYQAAWALERRINALVGVAEGMLAVAEAAKSRDDKR